MFEIIDWILFFQDTRQEEYLRRILDQVKPLMYKKSQKIDMYFREDIIQEFMVGTVQVVNRIQIFENKLDSQYFTRDNLCMILQSNYEEKMVSHIFHNPYLYEFIGMVGKDFFEQAFVDKHAFQELNHLFMKSNAQHQFFSILKKRFDSIIAQFYRRNALYLNMEVKSLNRMNVKGKENLEDIEDPSYIKQNTFDAYDFTEEEIGFLKLFIEDNIILTQQQVAKRLGASQQYVSKKLNQIKKKYKYEL